MNKADQRGIRKNLNLLAAHTSHVDELLELLEKINLVDSSEIENIKSQPTKYKRCTQIYLSMLRKGPEAFDLLHEALVESQNDIVADILKPDTSYGKPRPRLLRSPSQIEVDVMVQPAHIKNIVNVMEDTIAYHEWPVIVTDLLDASSQHQLSQLPSNTPFQELFAKTLELWVASKGTSATFNELLKVLDSRNQVDTAEALKNKYMKIFI